MLRSLARTRIGGQGVLLLIPEARQNFRYIAGLYECETEKEGERALE